MHKLDAHVPFPLELDFAPFSCAAPPAEHISQMPAAPAAPATAALAALAPSEGAPAAAAAAAAAEGGEMAAPLELYGVVEHQGSFEGGHYMCFARLGGGWYKFNDSKVRLTRTLTRTLTLTLTLTLTPTLTLTLNLTPILTKVRRVDVEDVLRAEAFLLFYGAPAPA